MLLTINRYSESVYQTWCRSSNCRTVIQPNLHCHPGWDHRIPNYWVVRSKQQPSTEQVQCHCGEYSDSEWLFVWQNTGILQSTYIPWRAVHLPTCLGSSVCCGQLRDFSAKCVGEINEHFLVGSQLNVFFSIQFLHQQSPSHPTTLVFSMLALPSPSPAPFNWTQQWTPLWWWPGCGGDQDHK